MRTSTRKHNKTASSLSLLSLFVVSEQEEEKKEKHGTKRHFDAWWDF